MSYTDCCDAKLIYLKKDSHSCKGVVSSMTRNGFDSRSAQEFFVKESRLCLSGRYAKKKKIILN